MSGEKPIEQKITLGDFIFWVDEKQENVFSGFVLGYQFEPRLVNVEGQGIISEQNHIGYTVIPFPLMLTPKGEVMFLVARKADLCAAYRNAANPIYMAKAYSSPNPVQPLNFIKVPLPAETERPHLELVKQ